MINKNYLLSLTKTELFFYMVKNNRENNLPKEELSFIKDQLKGVDFWLDESSEGTKVYAIEDLKKDSNIYKDYLRSKDD